MKFLAMLKDSLLESLDSYLIYVTVGLSLLVTVLASSVTFTPSPGADPLMRGAALPLDKFAVTSAGPVDGQQDVPGSTFKVELTSQGLKDDEARREIQDKFGLVRGTRIAEIVGDVEPGQEKGTYALKARLTSAGRGFWPHKLGLFFGGWQSPQPGPLAVQVFFILEYIVNGIGAWVGLLVSVGLTAYFVPNMLKKGTVDMLLIKPISRPVLLFYKYLGGLLFILLNTTVAVGGIWLALNLRSGLWSPGPLIAIPAITFFFAILYSVSVLFGVMTRNPIVSIVVTLFVWVCLFVVGTMHTAAAQVARAREEAKKQQQDLPPPSEEEKTFVAIVNALHYVLPRTSDVVILIRRHNMENLQGLPDEMLIKFMGGDDETINWVETLTVSCVFIAVMLGLACWWFSTKDY